MTPVFNELQARDPSGAGWIQRLLELPTRDGAHERPIVTPPLISGSLQYGKDEARLEPPRSLSDILYKLMRKKKGMSS